MLLLEFLETGVRISSERYVQTFKKLKTMISKVSARQDVNQVLIHLTLLILHVLTSVFSSP